MQSERALQKLNELRSVVDGDVAEMVDTLATVIILQQDISNPMYGAKITLYLRPPTEDNKRVDPEDAPDPQDDEWSWQWRKAGGKNDEPRYWFTPKKNEDDLDIIERKAIVFEPEVSDAGYDEMWDPNREEYVTPNEYPMGTVNCVVPASQDRSFADDYVYDVDIHTSIYPADGEPSPHSYTPGW